MSKIIRASSVAGTYAALRIPLLRFFDFFVRMWFLNACLNRTLPEAVLLKRLDAPEFVFILGIMSKNMKFGVKMLKIKCLVTFEVQR